MAHSVSIHECVSTIVINIIDSVNPRTDGSIIIAGVVIPVIIVIIIFFIITIGSVLIVINHRERSTYHVTETKDYLNNQL